LVETTVLQPKLRSPGVYGMDQPFQIGVSRVTFGVRTVISRMAKTIRMASIVCSVSQMTNLPLHLPWMKFHYRIHGILMHTLITSKKSIKTVFSTGAMLSKEIIADLFQGH
jgi:hypothetical protein